MASDTQLNALKFCACGMTFDPPNVISFNITMVINEASRISHAHVWNDVSTAQLRNDDPFCDLPRMSNKQDYHSTTVCINAVLVKSCQ